jgi:hypothetical protein
VDPQRRIGDPELAAERHIGSEDPGIVERREIEIVADDRAGDLDALPEDQALRPKPSTRCGQPSSSEKQPCAQW